MEVVRAVGIEVVGEDIGVVLENGIEVVIG